jgi:hypothetical protein
MRDNNASFFKIQNLLKKRKISTLWSADRPGQEAGPSTTLLEKSTSALSLSTFAVRPGHEAGPFA